MADRDSGAAMRRRQRRLRSWWRHEEQSTAALLATVSHLSYTKVDTANAALRGQNIGTSTRVGPAEYFELSSDDGRPPAVTRPASMLEPSSQGKVERHSGIGYELVQALDVPVLQMVEQLPNVLRFFVTRWPVGAEQVLDTVVSQQVLDVLKISQDRTRQRLVDTMRQPQTAEQLVEVLATVPCSCLHGNVEQKVDIPVPHRRGGRGVFKISALDRIQQRFVEQITLTIRFRVLEVFKVSSRDRLLALHPRTRLVPRMRLLQWFFSNFFFFFF